MLRAMIVDPFESTYLYRLAQLESFLQPKERRWRIF